MVSEAFLVLAASMPWVYALADALAETAQGTAMRFYDFLSYRRLRPAWPASAGNLRRVIRVMPPGYAGTLEPLFRWLMTTLIDGERQSLRKRQSAEPFVICPYPYLAPWLRGVPDERLIYYNLDAYTCYARSRSRAARIHRLENELVSRAYRTICLSAHQARELRARHAEQSDRIRHFPLGVVPEFLNPAPLAPPEPRTVCYIGGVADRIDWTFVGDVARLCPDVLFVFLGTLIGFGAGEGRLSWRKERDQVFALSNVRYLGCVPQAEVARYYWRYAINWMPYDRDHGFNIGACPTKIMDALASGRPFLSTDIPECRLYPDLIHVVETAKAAAQRIEEIFAGGYRHDPLAQIVFAANQTWVHRAIELRQLLTDSPQGIPHGPIKNASRFTEMPRRANSV